MQLVYLTDTEQRQQRLNHEALHEATKALSEDGFVGLVGAVDSNICDRLYDRMVAEYTWLQQEFGPFPVRGGDDFEGARYHGHSPQPAAPWIHRAIVCNPFAIQVSEQLMGAGVHVGNFNANWSLPAPAGTVAARQQPHGDAGHLFPGHGWTPPFIINLSIPIVDFTAANGATEIWPGTHRLERQLSEMNAEARKAALTQRRQEQPPLQMEAPKGTVVMRDPRAWHAGMPNLTDQPRIMLAMRHYVFWMRDTRNHQGDRIRERSYGVEAGSEHLLHHQKLIWRMHTIPAGDSTYLFESLTKACPTLTRQAFDERYHATYPFVDAGVAL